MGDPPSVTARRVAAARAAMERLPAAHGDPGAEDRLAASLATSGEEPLGEGMRRHLQGRTRFFDRVVVNAIGRGARQVAIIGAGYDGRALRYAAPDVRFFEVDRPGTQADKRARLDDLNIDTASIAFVACDLTDGGLDEALVRAGFSADAPTAMLCEGLLIYLDPDVLVATLDALRAVGAPQTRLALSITRPGRRDSADHARFRERVAAAGEPARNDLDSDRMADLLTDHRWRVVELPERAAQAGLMMGAPVWAPPTGAMPTTRGVVGRYLEGAMHRRGVDTLAAHLSAEHGLAGPVLGERDVGVFDARCADGRRVIVRLFPVRASPAAVARDAELLGRLRDAHDFPAEIPVPDAPVGAHEGQPLLLTRFARGGSAPGRTAQGRRRLGELLGRLHALDLGGLPALPEGGAWHHLVPEGGSPRAELDAMAALLEGARARVAGSELVAYRSLAERLAAADSCDGLPQALIHPDFVAANAIGSEPTIIDWAGCGIGPRLWSFAWLLWSARTGPGPVMEGYAAHVTLSEQERERLPAAMIARPVVLAAWTFATGRGTLAEALADAERAAEAAPRVAARVLRG